VGGIAWGGRQAVSRRNPMKRNEVMIRCMMLYNCKVFYSILQGE
jgi:hypothetical protein